MRTPFLYKSLKRAPDNRQGSSLGAAEARVVLASARSLRISRPQKQRDLIAQKKRERLKASGIHTHILYIYRPEFVYVYIYIYIICISGFY
jgi:hypothetical protein